MEVLENRSITSYAVNYTIQTLVDKLDKKQILVPKFQRKFVWGKKSIQAFLRYVLRDFPVYNLLLVADPKDPNKFIYLLDGLQRLTSLQMFLNGEIHLGEGRTFNKAYFSDLPEVTQQLLLLKEIQITKVEADKVLWPQLFMSVNSGSVPPNAIELRRAKFDLPLIFDLNAIAEDNHEWIAIFGKNNRHKGLSILLRAIAMHYYYESYQKPIEQFVNNFCMLQESPELAIDVHWNISKLQLIISSLYNNTHLGKNSFRLDTKKPINLGLIDCIIHGAMILLEKDDSLTSIKLGNELAKLYKKLLNDQSVIISLTMDTSGSESVKSRMSMTEEYLK